MLEKLKNVKLNKKGFTLAELLIVVAIIAVLVAVAIPVFSTSLQKAKDAVVAANLRSAQAEASSEYLNSLIDNPDSPTTTGSIEYDGGNYTYTWEFTGGKIVVTQTKP